MDKEDIKFDLITQRFIVQRWKTPIGLKVRDKIIDALRHSKNIREVLDPYVLEHPANIEPYEYPYYPPDAMEKQEFWVLTHNDLRGICLEKKDFSGSTSLHDFSLNYAIFRQCDLSGASLEKVDLAETRFEHCDLSNAIFAFSQGAHTDYIDTSLANASFLGCLLIDTDFSGSDFRGVYFEDTMLKHIKVSYLTKFDKKIHRLWHKRPMRTEQLPDLYRAIRMGYERAGLAGNGDYYFLRERVAYRKYVLWPRLIKGFSVSYCFDWVKDLIGSVIAGYGMQPLRTIFCGLSISIFYALVYFLAGTPIEASGNQHSFLSGLYFSFTTFATLGYGDLSYHEGRVIMRLLSTSEAWFGAIFIALFVVVVARKIFRESIG